MLSLLINIITFFCNGWLAYMIAKPEDRQGLIVFIFAWLVLILLSRSTHALLSFITQLQRLFKGNERVVARFKEKGQLSYQTFFTFLYTILGILLWKLLKVESLWDAYMFILIWKLLSISLLTRFTTTKPATSVL